MDEDGNEVSTINRPITKAFLTGKPVSMHAYFLRKDKSPMPVALTVSPVILNDKPVGAIEVFRDITKEAEIDRMKSEFISLASHQLRTPLTALNLNVQLLAQDYVGKLNKEQLQVVGIAQVSVDRMQEIISTLLNITRIEAGGVAVTPIETDLAKLVREIAAEVEPKAAEKQIVISISVKGKLSPILTDPLLLKEVFANLIPNAVKYTPEKGKVSISLAKKGDTILSAVKDNGYGIPKSEHSRIFSKFFRAGNITSKESVGTGLGLYMVKGIIDSLSGKIWFESTPGKGTTFFMSLPIIGPPQKEGTTTIEHVQV